MRVPISARSVLAALAALLAAVTITVIVTSDDGPDGSHHRTVTIRVGTDAQRGVDDTLTVPATAVQKVASSEAGHHEGEKDETPEGVPAAQIEAGREKADQLAAKDQLNVVAPDAAPSQAGCRSRFLSSSFSSRRGVAPHMIVLHYTVSPNVAGWSDVDGVTAFFARVATQASSNYVLDGEGHCNYIVREVDKAWAQAAFNPFAISIEVINTGHEPVYIRPAGFRQLARIVHDAAKRWHIPLRVGAVSNCVPSRFGIVTHQMLGLCGGGHVDITNYDAGHAVINALVKAARALDVSRLDRLRCSRLNAWRAAGRPVAGTHAAVLRKRTLAAHHVTCLAGKAATR
jgi:hypothetical protein